MGAKLDYYEVLGVERDCNTDAIKKAYRKLAMQYHPDRNPGNKAAEEKFKEASEAYSVLQDAEKRAIYNQYGHDGLNSRGFGGGFEDIFSSFGDIFEDLFGGGFSRGRNANRPQKGNDLRYDIKIDFMEAVFGLETDIQINKMELCDVCSGSGAAEGSIPETCQSCIGSGQITHRQGFFTMSTPCNVCGGLGQVITQPCTSCRGSGAIRVAKTINVKIPPGVDDGMRLRLSGEGEPGLHDGPAGDLYVFIKVKPHKFFERHGQDVVCTLGISFVQAALGDTVMIETLEGEKELEIPKGTQAGELLYLKGAGIPSLRNAEKRGNQIVRVDVRTPTNLTKRQEELLEEFASLEETKFTSKLKKMFKSK